MLQGKAGGFVLAQNDTGAARELQVSGDQKLESGDLPGAMEDFRESRRLFFELGKPADAVTSGMGLAICKVYGGNFQGSRDVLLQGRDSLLSLDPQNDTLMANVYGLLGTVYNYLGDQEKALEIALEAVAVKQRIPNLGAGELEYNYYLIGAIYFARNDFTNAIRYERAARKGYLAAGMTAEYVETGINLGLALVRNGENLQALNVLLESAELANLNELEDNQKVALFLNIGLAHLEIGQREKAKEAFEKVMSMDRVPANYRAIAEGNLGLAFYYEGDTARSIEWLSHAVSLIESTKNPDPDETAKLLLHLAQAHRFNADDEAALEAVDQGIRWQLDLPKSIDLDTLSDYSRSCDRRTLLRLLSERASLLNTLGRPEKSLQAYRYAFSVIDRMRHTFLGEGSRQFLAAYVLPIYEKSLDVAWKLYSQDQKPEFFEEALLIAERNKSVLLLEAMQEVVPRNSELGIVVSHFADSLVKAERDLKNDIAWYQQQLYLSEKGGDSSRTSLYEGYLIEKQAALDRLATKIQKDFPYLGRRGIGKESTDGSGVSLAAIRSFCAKENRAVLEYFSGKNFTYALMVSGDQLVFERLSAVDQFTLAPYRKALSDWSFIYDEPTKAWQQLTREGFKWYRELMEPVFKGSIPPNLVIIPDGYLSYLPFEALLTSEAGEAGNYSGLDYLIRKSEISYAYSAKMLLMRPASNQATKYTGKALAFAPEYGKQDRIAAKSPEQAPNRNTNAALPGAKEEVQALSRHLKVESYAGKSATEATFKARASSHAVLHLAMHGVVNNAKADYSYLDFTNERIRLGQKREDGSLYAYELEQMRLPTQLVVLSACETGAGQLAKGEGVLSLGRGFRFAGAQSVVMSLWKLEDRATAQLMDLFYADLADELGKSAALRNAKLAYLEQSDDFTAHPGFWAGLVLIGNTDSLQKPIAPYPWILPFASLLIMFAGWGMNRFAAGKRD